MNLWPEATDFSIFSYDNNVKFALKLSKYLFEDTDTYDINAIIYYVN